MKLFIRVFSYVVMAAILILSANIVYAEQEQTKEPATVVNALESLQSKIKEVVVLKDGLEKKRKEMQGARLEYQNEIVQLKNEIDTERHNNNIDNYKQALKNKRIHNNLALIQRQLAYVDKINKLEYTLSQGIEEMIYLERKTKADLKIVKLLDDKDELVEKIDNSLKNYAPYATKFALDAKRLNFTPLPKIWQDISSKDEQKNTFPLTNMNKINVKR
jgi:hypothetical protein